MTNEQHIANLKKLKSFHIHNGNYDPDIDRAIEVLLEQDPCEDWYDVPSDEMTLEQARQAVKDLRKMWVELRKQQPCEDEYIKVPKKALKYRTAGMVAYNAEWLKNHFDLERAVICGEQQPCEDKRPYIKIFADLEPDDIAEKIYQICNEDKLPKVIESLTEYFDPEPCEDAISREAVRHILNHEIKMPIKVWKKLFELVDDLPPVTPQQEIIRCGQCKYAEVADPEDSQDGYTCQFHRGSIWFSGSYCSWAERRQDG